ncbi:hypothetical protein [Ferruginibacter albus]|uniref:hypothetical protein n=1 Tax=Ferruginibacter albus TaxID=2875540 RepID=UPI001CC6967E|nr:hypothetical protein [Ferruginibacter albus]UAY53165.1 hypothetical protein K9M53_05710 [Ferruginibacter albus]
MNIVSGINFSSRVVLVSLLLLSILFACNKEPTQTFASYKTYAPLQPGKYFIYELDSTVTTAFGTGFEVHHYLLKDSVADIIYDNTDRPSLRIFRYLKDSISDWRSINTILITPTDTRLEYREDNLLYIKLFSPVTDFNTWPGNSAIGNSPYFQNNDGEFRNWQFRYADIGASKTFNGTTYPNTVTVVQYDSTLNSPFYYKWVSEYQKGYEVYAEGVGLVYKDILAWEYQITTFYAGCKHVYPLNNQKDTTVAIDCNRDNCDSIERNFTNQHIIDCDTVAVNPFYSGYGVREVLIEHN